MPNYNQAHAFYTGVDLHARSMFVHVLRCCVKDGPTDAKGLETNNAIHR